MIILFTVFQVSVVTQPTVGRLLLLLLKPHHQKPPKRCRNSLRAHIYVNLTHGRLFQAVGVLSPGKPFYHDGIAEAAVRGCGAAAAQHSPTRPPHLPPPHPPAFPLSPLPLLSLSPRAALSVQLWAVCPANARNTHAHALAQKALHGATRMNQKRAPDANKARQSKQQHLLFPSTVFCCNRRRFNELYRVPESAGPRGHCSWNHQDYRT